MSIEELLGELEFELLDERRQGTRRYALRSNPYLRWWVTTYPNGTAELSWEFELGEYLKAKGMHASVQDELSLLVFPRDEARGPAEAEWLRAEIEKAKRHIASVDLLTGA